jgi:hypothetical protein
VFPQRRRSPNGFRAIWTGPRRACGAGCRARPMGGGWGADSWLPASNAGCGVVKWQGSVCPPTPRSDCSSPEPARLSRREFPCRVPTRSRHRVRCPTPAPAAIRFRKRPDGPERASPDSTPATGPVTRVVHQRPQICVGKLYLGRVPSCQPGQPAHGRRPRTFGPASPSPQKTTAEGGGPPDDEQEGFGRRGYPVSCPYFRGTRRRLFFSSVARALRGSGTRSRKAV